MASGRKVHRQVTRVVTAAVLVASIGLTSAVMSPASAEVTAVSPASREVDPGGATTATVTVSSEIPTCVSARPSDPRLAPSFSTTCDDEPTWRTTLTVQVPDQPGTYTVEIGDDRSNVTRRFELRVRAPAPPPPPPPPSTTTTAPATTTTRAPTTTAAPPTTAPPAPEESTTTAAPETTTTLTPPPPGGGFVPIASLVDQGVPERGVFLPLTGAGYRRCLPLAAPCVVADSALVIVPARATELAWPVLADGAIVPPRLDLRGVAPLQPVGRPPEDPGAQDYALPLLDLAAAGGQLRTLVRGLDAEGRLLTPRAGGAVSVPRAEGPMAAPEADTFLASTPFGRPELRTSDDFTEAAPAIVLFSATQLQVVYAIRPVPAWGLNVELLPLLTAEAVPYLVRGVDGPPGLYLPLPDGVRVPEGDDTEAGERAADGGSDGGLPAVGVLAGAVGAGVVLTGALAWRRRRRAPLDQ